MAKNKNKGGPGSIHTLNGVLQREFKPKSQNQSDYVRAIVENDLTICIGCPGAGKTACSVGVGIGWFMEGKYDRLIITRPAVGADEENDKGLGFIPGDIRDKMDPFLRPIFDELNTYLDKSTLEKFMHEQKIEIAPLYYCQGRTFHNSYVIVDEAQNASYQQLKMITTRLGSRSKMVISGDVNQHNRPWKRSGLDVWVNEIVKDMEGVAVCKLEKIDIVRHKLVGQILDRTESYEEKLKGNK